MKRVIIQVMAFLLVLSCLLSTIPFITRANAADDPQGFPKVNVQVDVQYTQIGAIHYTPLLDLQRTLTDGVWKHNGKYTTYVRPQLKLVFDSIKLKWWYEVSGKLVPITPALKKINNQLYIPIEGILKLKEYTKSLTIVKQGKSSMYRIMYSSPWELLHDQLVENSKEPDWWINRLTGELYQQVSGQPKWLATTTLRANQSLSFRLYRPNAQSMYVVVVDNSGEPSIHDTVYQWLFTNEKLILEKSAYYNGAYIKMSQYIHDRFSIMNDLKTIQYVASNGMAVREMDLRAFGLANKGINVIYATDDIILFSENHFIDATTYVYSFVTKELTKLNKPNERLQFVKGQWDQLEFQRYDFAKPNDKPIVWKYTIKPEYNSYDTLTRETWFSSEEAGFHKIEGIQYADLKALKNNYRLNLSVKFTESVEGLLTGERPYFQLAWKVGAKYAMVNGKQVQVTHAPRKVNNTVVYPIEDLVLLSGGNFEFTASKETEYALFYDYAMLSDQKMTTWIHQSTGDVWMKESTSPTKYITKLSKPLVDLVSLKHEQLGAGTTLLHITDVYGEPHLHSHQFKLLIHQGKALKQSLFDYYGFSDWSNISSYDGKAVMVANDGMELVKSTGETILNLKWSEVMDEEGKPLSTPKLNKSYSVKYIDKQISLIVDLQDKNVLLVDLQTKQSTLLYRKLLTEQDIKFIDEFPDKNDSGYRGDGLTFEKREGNKLYLQYVKMFTNDTKELIYTLK